MNAGIAGNESAIPRGLSRRNRTKVARHEMPGSAALRTRPVLSAIARMATEEGYGLIGWRGYSTLGRWKKPGFTVPTASASSGLAGSHHSEAEAEARQGSTVSK